jgi:ketosteroid isomerase-like protein
MSVALADRDALFRKFGSAFVKRDIELLYTIVSEDFTWRYSEASGVVGSVTGKDKVLNHMQHQADRLVDVKFHHMVWHHVGDASFGTFRLSARDADTGDAVEERGIEYYTFKDGRVNLKDVYRKYDL